MTKKKTELYHGTFTITRTWLEARGACYSSMTALDAARLLPITISTDPDENVDLAVELVQTTAWPYMGLVYFEPITRWLHWLALQASSRGEEGTHLTDFYQANEGTCFYLRQIDLNRRGGECDPTLLAQLLAMLADAFLIGDGR